jgi:hypothetical protein
MQFHYLDVESDVANVAAGGSTPHTVKFRSYAVKDVTVGFTSDCATRLLRYRTGPQWSPPPVTLQAVGIGGPKYREWSFDEDLHAPASTRSGQSEQLAIDAWRQAHQAPVERFVRFHDRADVT